MNKLILALGAAVLFFGAAHLFSSSPAMKESLSIPREWSAFMTKYNKKYNADEKQYRFQIYLENLRFIEEENKKGHSYTLGENQLMDITSAEFKAFYLGAAPTKGVNDKTDNVHQRVGYPPEVDWSAQDDKVQRVKDQGQCGSCWAFSAIGATESADAVFNNHLGDYSEQQLVDCSKSYGNHGCNGGLMNYAFKFIIDHGITTEEDYPYEARDQTCQKKDGSFKIASYTKVPKKILDSECKDLKSAIAQQPVAVGVDAETWQFYSGGVFTNCGKQLDHGVLAVGYTDDYWKIKNSWSASWGEKGYIRLGKGNTCGVCNTASYPSV